MVQLYKPTLDNSTVNIDPTDPNVIAANAAAKSVGGVEQQLKNSGYIPVPPAGTGSTTPTPPPSVPNPGAAPAAPTIDPLTGLPTSFNDKAVADMADLKKLQASIGLISDQEAYDLKTQAANEVGGQFDVAINDAIEKAKQGNATATVRGGQRGGFESTQIAGVAAVAPTVGGTFTGQGGQLEKIASAYDLNIQNLKVQKQAAINAAYAELRKAKISGQQANFDNATKLFEAAQKANNDAMDLAVQKLTLMQKTQDYNKSTRTDASTQVAQNIIDLLTGDPTSDEQLINKYAIDNNLNPGDLKAAVRKVYDEQSFYKSSDIINMVKTLPAGQTQTITDPNTGRTYTITGTAQPDTISVTNDEGVVSILNKNTGKIISQTEAGVGKTKTQAANITVNAAGGRNPVYLDGKQIGWQAYNPNSPTGAVINTGMDGKVVDSFPSGYQIGTWAAGNPSNEDNAPLF